MTSPAAEDVAPAPTESPPSDPSAPEYRAAFFHQATPATKYWRCDLPAKYLPGRVLPATSLEVFREVGEDGEEHLYAKNFDVPAVVQFPGDQGTAFVTMVAAMAGKKLFVEVDDQYLENSDPLWHKRSGWGSRIGGQEPHTTQGHRWITRHAHGVIVTTEALADMYGEVNENVHVCRNSIDPDDWPAYEKPDDGVFRIGWYASGSHDRDQEMCRKAIAWASRQPDVEIVNIGLNPTGWRFARRQVSWNADWLALRPELMKLDVGIAPLVANPNTRYRSDLKALEYSMGGAMPILQASPPYDDWRDKSFARMCWTESDWEEAIRWAVRNRDEVRELGRQTREHVLAERTFKTEIERWRKAVES